MRKKRRRRMKFETYQRLCICNSEKLPEYVEIDGRRMEWVGIGVIDVGPAHGDEVLIVE